MKARALLLAILFAVTFVTATEAKKPAPPPPGPGGWYCLDFIAQICVPWPPRDAI